MRAQLIRFRNALLRSAQRVGAAQAIGASSWRRHRLLILCYHGVSLRDEHLWSDLYVPQELLDQRLQALKRLNATVLPLQEALPLLEASQLPPRAVAITFDDGAYDFLTRAHPVLEAHRVPTMLYLTTYHADKEFPVFNPVISYLMWRGGGRTVTLPLDIGTVTLPASSSDPRHQALHQELRRRTAALSAIEKNEVARQLASAVGEDYDALCAMRLFHIMRTSDLRQLNLKQVSVELHTHRHRVPRDAALFGREISDNRRAISAMLGTAPEALRHFCYPSGEYYPEFVPWLRDSGVLSATTCVPGLASARSHPQLLPRFIDTYKVSQSTFDAWVLGTGALLSPRPGLPWRGTL